MCEWSKYILEEMMIISIYKNNKLMIFNYNEDKLSKILIFRNRKS